jgi:hypothetical protein
LPGAEVPYSAALVVGVAEAARSSSDVVDEPVDALGLGVGDAGGVEPFGFGHQFSMVWASRVMSGMSAFAHPL